MKFVPFQMERTLAMMVFFLLVVWLVSWTPYAVISLWSMVGAENLTPGAAVVPTVMCKLSGTVNGFVYGVR